MSGPNRAYASAVGRRRPPPPAKCDGPCWYCRPAELHDLADRRRLDEETPALDLAAGRREIDAHYDADEWSAL